MDSKGSAHRWVAESMKAMSLQSVLALNNCLFCCCLSVGCGVVSPTDINEQFLDVIEQRQNRYQLKAGDTIAIKLYNREGDLNQPQIHVLPDGRTDILYMHDEKVAGMTRLDKFDEGIGMIHNVYIYPTYRGRGLSKQMMYVVEEKAREFGYRFLRLDTGGFNVVAQNLYRKLGYVEIERFIDFENLKNERTRPYYFDKLYMEKQL